jgi:invasion protein IalB
MIAFAPQRPRLLLAGAALAFACMLGSTPDGLAKEKASHSKTDKAASKKDDAKPAKGEPGKATQLGTFGEWGAYATQGKSKTCYALAQPKSREPSSVKRDPAYVFISTRPAENVKSEISIIMGFPMKDGAEAQVEIGEASFGLIAKGSNAWVKNPAEEGRLIDAMKKGSKLVVKASSAKGKATTDTYSLSGLGQALDKVRKECQ